LFAFPKRNLFFAKGANQHAQLGLALRRAYGGFLPSLASQVYVRSTDVERTFLSARHILGAAFPANSSFVVNTMDPFMDNAFPNPQICPALGTAMATVMSRFVFSCFVLFKFLFVFEKQTFS
jgi:hypothetical protein